MSLMRCAASAAFALLIAGAGAPLAGQSASSDGHADEGHHFHRNDVAVFLGATTPLDKARGGETSVTAGVEYERRFTRVAGAQARADFSFGDLKREAIFVALLTLRPIEPLRFSLGPGVELVEEDKIEEDGSVGRRRGRGRLEGQTAIGSIRSISLASGLRMACHRSQFCCPLSQNSGEVPKRRDNRRAVSGVIPRFPFTISFTRG